MTLPVEVARAVIALVGEPWVASSLGGLSGTTVPDVSGPTGRVVVKGPVGAAERHVTVELAVPLLARGVRLGRCLAAVETPDGPWLLLEHLPGAWPRERWGPDLEALGMLRALHGVDPGLLDDVPDRFHPVWDDAVTEVAASVLEVHVRRLAALQHRAAPLLEPVGVVSADPNPLNWRLDAQGRATLVDQGRLTLARPEVDLAILLPGLPTRVEAEAVVASYGSGDPGLVLIAKAWTLVELASSRTPGHDLARELRTEVAVWLDQTWPR